WEVVQLPLPSLQELPGQFSLYDSKQVFLKYYSPQSQILNLRSVSEINSDLNDKIVFVGSEDNHSTFITLHPFGRFSTETEKSSRYYFSEIKYLMTVYQNLKNLDYIRVPSEKVNILWTALWMALGLGCLFWGAHRPGLVFLALLVIPLCAFVVSLFFFRYFSLNLESSRIFIGLFVFQYLGVPMLFIKYQRRVDALRLEQEKTFREERFKTRLIAKIAKADMTLKMAAKVSHDIRSPLTALQIASSFLKGKVPEDMESLIKESTARIRYIADDILQVYKGSKEESEDAIKVNLSILVEELLLSYKHLYSGLRIEKDIPPDIICEMPQYSLQRCLSNLLNNSIEAFGNRTSEQAHIEISAFSDDSHITLQIRDNAGGVAEQIVPRLFQEKATYGKKEGTGLGLYQVRKELENYGASIVYKEIPGGACFILRMPRTLAGIPLVVSKNILLLETNEEISPVLKQKLDERFNLIICRSVDQAQQILKKNTVDLSQWTVVTDLTLGSDEETGFDIVNQMHRARPFKVVMVTSLSDHPDVQQLAENYDITLLKKRHLSLLNVSMK
ncbi:MAG: HAMP domain-containing sensor histidine kinase, partial [Bdellovibrio sp.]